MDYGPSDTSTTSLSTNQFPISEVYVPNDALRALEGGPVTIDGSSKKSSPISVYGKAGTFVDGSDATQGLKADTAATDSTSSWSVVALLKGLYAKLAGTLTVSGIVTTSGTVTEANSAAIKADLDTLATNTADLLADGEHLAAIDTSTARIPAQGQALAGASMPVVLPVAQITTLTPPAAITGFALEAGNLASIKSDLDEIATDTDNLATMNTSLTTLAGVISSSKASVKAASGDFADGAITSIGANADAAVTGDNPGTQSAKFRGFNKMLFDMWDSTNHWLQVKVMNGNANGQATMTNSAPVAPASDYIGPVKPNNLSIAGAGTGTVNGSNTDIIPSTDMSGYADFSFQMTGTWTMTLTIQGSNDNSNFVSVVADTLNSTNQLTPSTIISSNNVYSGRIRYRYLRIRATAWTSNASGVGTLWLSSIPVANTPVVTMNTPASGTSGGTTGDYHLISAATTNANNVKASGGQIYGYDLGNSGASDAWVKIYNASSAPTAGSGTPFRVVYVPKGGRSWFHSTTGIKLGTGIGITITGGAADADTTAVAASQVTVEIDYV